MPCPPPAGRQAGPATGSGSGTAAQPAGRPGWAVLPCGGWRSPCARCTHGGGRWHRSSRPEGRPGGRDGPKVAMTFTAMEGERPAAGWLTDPPPPLCQRQPSAAPLTDRQTDAAARRLAPSQCYGHPRPVTGDGAVLLCGTPGRLLAGELVLHPQPTASGL